MDEETTAKNRRQDGKYFRIEHFKWWLPLTGPMEVFEGADVPSFVREARALLDGQTDDDVDDLANFLRVQASSRHDLVSSAYWEEPFSSLAFAASLQGRTPGVSLSLRAKPHEYFASECLAHAAHIAKNLILDKEHLASGGTDQYRYSGGNFSMGRETQSMHECGVALSLARTGILVPSSQSLPQAQELGSQERQTLLKIIALLASTGHGWNGQEPYALAGEVFKDAATKGIGPGLSERTMGDKLKEAASILKSAK